MVLCNNLYPPGMCAVLNKTPDKLHSCNELSYLMLCVWRTAIQAPAGIKIERQNSRWKLSFIAEPLTEARRPPDVLLTEARRPPDVLLTEARRPPDLR